MPFRPRYTGLIERYRDRLPVSDDTKLISLGEGNTPLLKLNNIPKVLGKDVEMHKYAVQITVADSRDGACSSSTLKEASSWGKVDVTKEQMVFAEATSVLPLIASDAYHKGEWKNRDRKNFTKIFG